MNIEMHSLVIAIVLVIIVMFHLTIARELSTKTLTIMSLVGGCMVIVLSAIAVCLMGDGRHVDGLPLNYHWVNYHVRYWFGMIAKLGMIFFVLSGGIALSRELFKESNKRSN